MKTPGHIVASAVLLSLYPILGDGVIVSAIASVVMDVDHMCLLVQEKAFTPSKIKFLYRNINSIYQEDPKNAFKRTIYIFHTIEFNILLLVAAFWCPVLFLISLGFIFHILCDILHHSMHGMPIKRWLFLYEFLGVNKK